MTPVVTARAVNGICPTGGSGADTTRVGVLLLARARHDTIEYYFLKIVHNMI